MPKMKHIVTFLLLLFCYIGISKCVVDREREREILEDILKSSRYDRGLRGYNNSISEPTVVTFDMYVRNFEAIDDINLKYRILVTIRMNWMDKRLSYKTKNLGQHNVDVPYITLSDWSQIWTPAVLFANELEVHEHNHMKPNTYTRIFPDGSVTHSTRLTLTLSCMMQFKLFPFDSQVCGLRLTTNAITKDELIFEWRHDDALYLTSNLYPPKFDLERSVAENCDDHSGTGVYSYVRAGFALKRNLHHYLIQVYIPTFIFVLLSYSSFWIDRKDSRTRLITATLSLLVLIMTSMALNTSFPPVCYIRAVDIWLGSCIAFVIGCLVTCIVVQKLKKREPNANIQNNCTRQVHCSSKDDTFFRNLKVAPISTKIDILARLLFPFLFLLFALIYFATFTLLGPSNIEVENVNKAASCSTASKGFVRM